MPEQKNIKPGVIGTEDAVIITEPPGDGDAQVFTILPLPEAWKEFVNFDAEAFWKEQDRERRRRRERLEACEFDDDDIPDDSRFTLPGYDPDDFREGA